MPSTDSKYAVGAAWAADLEDVTTPSGQTCQVRKPGIKNLIGSGILNNGDVLLSIVENKHVAKARGKAAQKDDALDLRNMLQNPQQLEQILDGIDSVVMHIVVQPTIVAAPKDDNGDEIPFPLRPTGVGYIDAIPLEDKMFLFNYAVGGSSDLERFRVELDQHARDLDDGQDVPRPAKRAAGRKSPS